MTDNISKEKRSWNMSKILAKNTKPEIIVRSVLHKAGYRFRLHVSTLPGKPDIVLAKYKTVVFVNGCFWHRHVGCKYTYTPKSRIEFWEEKFRRNIERDQFNKRSLEQLGWKVVTVWECETENEHILEEQLKMFLPLYIKSTGRKHQVPALNDKK